MLENKKENILEYINSVNKFLYKYLFIGILVNLYLYFFPSTLLSILFYSILIIYFLINFFQTISKSLFKLFAQILVIFLVNLNYMTWIIGYIFNELILQRSVEDIMHNNFYELTEVF